jgi:hypothetical protein
MVKKLIFASKEGEFPRPKAHAASLWLVKTKRRPVFSLKTLLSMNGRELRE